MHLKHEKQKLALAITNIQSQNPGLVPFTARKWSRPILTIQTLQVAHMVHVLNIADANYNSQLQQKAPRVFRPYPVLTTLCI